MGIVYLIIAVLKRSRTLSWIARGTKKKKTGEKNKKGEEGGKQGQENS